MDEAPHHAGESARPGAGPGPPEAPRDGEAAAAPTGKPSRRTPARPCLNCGDRTIGRYCPSCGQAKREVAVSVRALLADVLEDQLILSRALPRTLLGLFFRPGFLTDEYTAGRIVRYIAPFRLYLAASVVFFLLLSLVGLRSLDIGVTGDVDVPQVRATADSLASAAVQTGADPDSVQALMDRIEAMPDFDLASAVAASGGSESQDPLERLHALAAPPDGLQPWTEGLQISVGDEGASQRLRQRILERFGHMPANRALRDFLAEYLSYVPTMVFVLLPAFALVLKLLYVRRGRYYAEHFIFALHVHAFVFVMFTVMLIPYGPLRAAVLAWIPLYVWFALKRVYGQGIVKTSLKYAALGVSYAFLLLIGLGTTVMVTFVTL